MKTRFTSGELCYSFLRASDLPDIVRMLRKENVCEYLSFGPNTADQTHAYFDPIVDSIRKSISMDETPFFHVFTIRNEREDFLGQCALVPIDYCPGNLLFGITLEDTAWHRGYGTQACGFLVRYGFQTLGLRRISGDCIDGNEGSRRIMEKNGFKLEGRQRNYWHKNDRPRDQLLFGILREDWKEQDASAALVHEF